MTHQWTLKPHSEWKCFGRLVGLLLFDGFGSTWFSNFPPYAAVHVGGTSTLTTARLTNKSPAVDTWTTRHDSSGSGSWRITGTCLWHENVQWKMRDRDLIFSKRISWNSWCISINNSVQTPPKKKQLAAKFWNHPIDVLIETWEGYLQIHPFHQLARKKHQEKWKTSNPDIGFKIPTFNISGLISRGLQKVATSMAPQNNASGELAMVKLWMKTYTKLDEPPWKGQDGFSLKLVGFKTHFLGRFFSSLFVVFFRDSKMIACLGSSPRLGCPCQRKHPTNLVRFCPISRGSMDWDTNQPRIQMIVFQLDLTPNYYHYMKKMGWIFHQTSIH